MATVSMLEDAKADVIAHHPDASAYLNAWEDMRTHHPLGSTVWTAYGWIRPDPNDSPSDILAQRYALEVVWEHDNPEDWSCYEESRA